MMANINVLNTLRETALEIFMSWQPASALHRFQSYSRDLELFRFSGGYKGVTSYLLIGGMYA
jgi:hypothetical protein